MAINVERAKRMARKPSAELVKIVKGKTLSSAAAEYQLRQRKELHLLAEAG